MGHIFYLMGKSASGKDTIYRKLKEALPALSPVVIYTTRPKRAGEKDGDEYHFTGEDTVGRLKRAGRIIELREYHTVHGIWKYFTVDDGQFDTDKSMIAIGTPASYMKMREYFGAERIVPIYIEAEDGERLERALERERKQKEPRYEEMCRRFLADAADFAPERLKEAGITRAYVNDSLDRCAGEIISDIRRTVKEI